MKKWLIVGLFQAVVFSSIGQISPPGGWDGGTNTNGTPVVVNTNKNFIKFAGQGFLTLKTNDLASSNPSMYQAVASLGSGPTAPNVQTRRFNNSILIRANHFDYSSESRDFALLISDKVETSTWKNIDFNRLSDSKDGWLVQGMIPRRTVTDTMFMMVTNIPGDCNAFFRVIPYAGPQITVSGVSPHATVAGNVSVQLDILDLSGTTNHQVTITADGDGIPFSFISSNTISVDTKFVANGQTYLVFTVANGSARLFNETNSASNIKTAFESTSSLPLDFENQTYVYMSGNSASPDIGTNFFVFGVTPPHYISASVKDKANGRVLKSWSGYNPSYEFVQLDWNFTDSNHTSPFTNDDYIVTFAVSSSAQPALQADASPIFSGQVKGAVARATSQGSTTITMTNKLSRAGVRKAKWVISTYEEMDNDWLDRQAETWFGTEAVMYENLYWTDWLSIPQYYDYQIGAGRNTPQNPKMPIALRPSNQNFYANTISNLVINTNYSDYNYNGHSNGEFMGGGPSEIPFLNHVSTVLTANQVWAWVVSAGKDNRMRKVALWGCYTARCPIYGNWFTAFGIDNDQLGKPKYKNVGLFFDDELQAAFYGDALNPISYVALAFDQTWVMGPNSYPGGCNPNYSFAYALNSTTYMFPELTNAVPVIRGCPYLTFNGEYDWWFMHDRYDSVKP